MRTENALQGKRALVTGGTRGIGLAIVKALAENDADVYFTYKQSEAQARETLEGLRKAFPGRKFGAIRCDVSKTLEMRETISDIVEKDGPLDILVNNAGIIKDSPLAMMGFEAWKEVMDVNLDGTFNASRAVILDFLKRKSGNIVNITSVAGVYGNAGQTNYSASKAGIIGFTYALAKEAGPYGVRVNAVAPGFIETDMSGEVLGKQLTELNKKIALRRPGRADEVAKAVLFLVSDQASYITGQVLMVDGGISL